MAVLNSKPMFKYNICPQTLQDTAKSLRMYLQYVISGNPVQRGAVEALQNLKL